jgi:uncharacterized protein
MNAPEIYDAAVFGDFATVERLLESGPEVVNTTDEYGFTPLHGVAGEDQLPMAQYLISKGAHVSAKNDVGITPLHLAAYPDMVELLVKNGADLESREAGGGTPLHVAAERHDSLDVMERLLHFGAAVNATDSSGYTPLDIAFSRDEQEKIELLLSFGGLRGGEQPLASQATSAAKPWWKLWS